MKNVLIWILALALIAYIIYAAVHKKAVAPDQGIGSQTTDLPTIGDSAGINASAPTNGTSNPAPSINSNNTTTKDGMTIETTTQGTGPEIATGQTAVVTYTGKLTDGTVFDASSKHGGEPFSFTLGAGRVIKGWEEGVLGMKVGETRMLTIPPELGYGPDGIPGVIPGNATLIFEVTLKAIK